MRPRLPRSVRDDRGMVTAETAVVLPALVVLVCAAISAVIVATGQLRCVDAAREAARAAARGESVESARGLAVRAAPASAAVSVSFTADRAVVTVAAEVHPLGGFIPAVKVHGRAVSLREPGVP